MRVSVCLIVGVIPSSSYSEIVKIDAPLISKIASYCCDYFKKIFPIGSAVGLGYVIALGSIQVIRALQGGD